MSAELTKAHRASGHTSPLIHVWKTQGPEIPVGVKAHCGAIKTAESVDMGRHPSGPLCVVCAELGFA